MINSPALVLEFVKHNMEQAGLSFSFWFNPTVLDIIPICRYCSWNLIRDPVYIIRMDPKKHMCMKWPSALNLPPNDIMLDTAHQFSRFPCNTVINACPLSYSSQEQGTHRVRPPQGAAGLDLVPQLLVSTKLYNYRFNFIQVWAQYIRVWTAVKSTTVNLFELQLLNT